MTQITLFSADDFDTQSFEDETRRCLEAATGDAVLDSEVERAIADGRDMRLRECLHGIRRELDEKNGGNPNWGHHILAHGVVDRWNGPRTGYTLYHDFASAIDCSPSRFGMNNMLADCDIDSIAVTIDGLRVRGNHHDGSVDVIMRQLTPKGEAIVGDLVHGYIDGKLKLRRADGRRVTLREGDEGDLMAELWNNPAYSCAPRPMTR